MTPRTPQEVGDTITTAEELDALPRGATVVIDDAEGSLVAVKDGGRWHTVGMDPLPSADIWDISRDPEEGGPTPVVLVHLPGHPPRPEREVKAEALREAASDVASIAPYGAELRPDGSEDRLIAAWVEGLHDAHVAILDRADRIARGDH